jgi:hypothetical protein
MSAGGQMRWPSIALAMALAASLAFAAKAQPVHPASVASQAEPSLDNSNPFLRCAGLYTAFLGHARALAPTVVSAIESSIKVLTMEAAEARAEVKGGTRDQYREAIERETRALGVVYTDRLEKNYESSGDPIKDDAMIQTDMKLCKALTDGLEQPRATGPRN